MQKASILALFQVGKALGQGYRPVLHHPCINFAIGGGYIIRMILQDVVYVKTQSNTHPHFQQY